MRGFVAKADELVLGDEPADLLEEELEPASHLPSGNEQQDDVAAAGAQRPGG